MRGAQTEGESRILSKVSGLGKFLSPTRFAGAPPLAEGAKDSCI